MIGTLVVTLPSSHTVASRVRASNKWTISTSCVIEGSEVRVALVHAISPDQCRSVTRLCR
jgi:hypothetical protein